jgi:hypothetical protein
MDHSQDQNNLKITVVIDDNGKHRVGNLELTQETIDQFNMIGIDAIEQSIIEVIRRMLETHLS